MSYHGAYYPATTIAWGVTSEQPRVWFARTAGDRVPAVIHRVDAEVWVAEAPGVWQDVHVDIGGVQHGHAGVERWPVVPDHTVDEPPGAALSSGGSSAHLDQTPYAYSPLDERPQVLKDVLSADRRYFEEHPDATDYLRPYVPGELWPSHDTELSPSQPLAMLVRRTRKGNRERVALAPAGIVRSDPS